MQIYCAACRTLNEVAVPTLTPPRCVACGCGLPLPAPMPAPVGSAPPLPMNPASPPLVPTPFAATASPPAPRSSPLAAAALFAGLVSFCTGPPAILAIVLGAVALGQIRRAEGRLEGRRAAIAAIVLGIAGLFIFTAGTTWLVFHALGWEQHRRAEHDAEELRTIQSFLAGYMAAHNGEHPADIPGELLNPGVLGGTMPAPVPVPPPVAAPASPGGGHPRRYYSVQIYVTCISAFHRIPPGFASPAGSAGPLYRWGDVCFVRYDQPPAHARIPMNQLLVAWFAKVDDHQPARAALFADGTVTPVNDADFPRLIEQQNKLRAAEGWPPLEAAAVDHR